MIYPSGYAKDVWYHKIIYINESEGYDFPIDMKIKIQCDASNNRDKVFIDQLYVNATTGVTETSNFSGQIDEFCIYNRTLSAEQIYQNYLSTKSGLSSNRVIVSEEATLDDVWQCTVTPNNAVIDDVAVESNTLQIESYNGGG